MRTNKFTFKKTKKIKVVEEHKGLSVDLTLQEASDLLAIICRIGGISKARTETFEPLLDALKSFLSENGKFCDYGDKGNDFRVKFLCNANSCWSENK